MNSIDNKVSQRRGEDRSARAAAITRRSSMSSAGNLAHFAVSRQVGGDGVGGVAVQAVAGVVVPAGGAGVFVAGVVLHVAQGGAGVQGEGDRRMAQAVRRELLPRADPGGAGQAAHELPQVALAEPPAGGG